MLKKIYVGFAFFLFFISLFLGIDRFAHRQSHCFTLDKIHSHQAYSPSWDIAPLAEAERAQLDHILSQKFTYYSKGSQAFVFLSEDKQYILKFLKQGKLRPKSWLCYIPLSFNPYYQEYLFKKKKCEATFSACKTAFEELKSETGLLYVHLNHTRDLNKTVTIYDKNHKQHTVALDKTCYYVQKRAQLIYSRIAELMHNKDVEGAKQIITSVFSLIDHLGKKGVVDNDPILRKNFGLIDDVAVQIDVGKLRIDPKQARSLAYKKEIASITHSFKVWLEKNYPELNDHYISCLENTSKTSDLQSAALLPE